MYSVRLVHPWPGRSIVLEMCIGFILFQVHFALTMTMDWRQN